MGLREENFENRRRRIMSAASEIILSRGAEALSMRSLANHAGVSVTTLYNHFANKDDLLLEIVNTSLEAVAPMIQAQSTRQPLEALLSMITVPVRHMTFSEALFRPMIFAGYQSVATRGAPVMVALYARLIGMMTELVTAARNAGDLMPEVAPEVVAAEIFYTYRLALEDWACEEIDAGALERRIECGALFVLVAASSRKRRPQLLEALLKAQSQAAGDLGLRYHLAPPPKTSSKAAGSGKRQT